MVGSFPVSGNIDAKTFPFLVMDLHHHGATGSLKVDGPTYQKALYVRAGRILFGSSNDPRDQLGAILIDSGKLTPEQLEEVNGKVGPGNPLAKVLTDSGLVTQQELSDAARAKVERILGDVIAYAEGSFEFEDGVLPKGAVDLKLDSERLVLGAVRNIGDRSFVLGHLGSLEVVLAPTPSLAGRASDIASETGGLAAELDGRTTLKEAIARTRLDEFDGAKIASALLFLGLVEPMGRPARPPSAQEEDSPFFVADSGDAELDLGATARMAFGGQSTASAPRVSAPSAAAPLVEPPASADAQFSEEPIAVFAPDEPEPIRTVPPPASDVGFEIAPPAPVFRLASPPVPPEPAPSAPSISAPAVTDTFPSFTVGTSTAPTETPSARPSFPQIDPPNEHDLVALDALLHPRQAERAPERGPERVLVPSVPRANVRDYARFGPQGTARRSSDGGGWGWTVVALLLLLVAIGGVGWWWFVAGHPGFAGFGGEGATPSPVAASPLPPPTLAPQVTEATPAPSAAPEIAASKTTPLAATSTAGLPVTAPPSTPTPPPATAPPATATGAEPRALIRAGRFPEAARAFATRARADRSRFTVQILVACTGETIQKALDNDPSQELYIVPVTLKGHSCYRLCWGIYDSTPLAEDAQRRLPDYFRQGGALPRVVPVAAILP
jgi:hypothetical protein